MDVSQLGFYAEFACPVCGAKNRVNDTLANFRIESILGCGGMSVVFSARDLVLGRELAIKVLNDIYRDNPERITRFEKECSMMARVRHENVVSVYSAGWSRGQFYIAMEKVEGRNLELLLAEHKCLMQDEALDVIRQVASGLQAAQAAGVLHRDMKPGNIIITPEGHAKVLDFGLSLEDRPDALREEIIWATPFYVPPETLEGKTEDARTDMYALGMTLRSMVTGVTNFSDPIQALDVLLAKKKALKPMAELYPHLDEGFCDLVDHMTAFSPEARPAGYEELLDEIAEVQSQIGGASEELKKRRFRRLRWFSGGLGVAALGCLSAVIVAKKTPPPPLCECVTVPSFASWEGRIMLQDACEQLKDGDFDNARNSFSSLSEKSTEPVIRLAAYLMHLLADDASVVSPSLLSVLRDRIIDASAGNAADRALAAACSNLPELLESRSLTPEALSAELPVQLRSAVLMLAARHYIALGNGNGAALCLDAAIESLSASPYTAPMADTVRNQRRNLTRVMVQGSRAYVRSQMCAGNTASALDVLHRMDTTHFSPLELAEHEVQKEYCKIAAEAFALLQRKAPHEFKPDATPEEMKKLTQKLGKYQLADEMFCLVCMLRGDYAGAFAANPHRDNPNSREPFAILMRHWKLRLGL